MITGAAQMDAAILVVSAAHGPQEQTREHIILSHEVGVPHVVIFLNKMDLLDDLELGGIMEEEIRELLTRYGFVGKDSKCVKGAAKFYLDTPNDVSVPFGRLAMDQLMDVLDHLPLDNRANDKPFLMAIEDIFGIIGRGTVVTGKIEQGIIKINENVQIIGHKPVTKVAVGGIEMFNKLLDHAESGDNAGILLKGLKKEEVTRGDVVCKPESLKAYTTFEGRCVLLGEDEGGRKKGFTAKYQPQFFIRTADVTGKFEFPQGKEMCMPGDHVVLKITLIHPIPMQNGMRFAIREGKITIGAGIISKVIV